MRVAALDLGSNTFLLLIADMNGDRIEKVISDETQVTRLGQGVHLAREFHPDALARAEACLSEFASKIRAAGCGRVLAVATSAARDVKNGNRLLEIGKKHGIPIQIISGDDEATITYEGATSDLKDSRALVIDVGGGSTEVIGRDQAVTKGCSLDIGSVRLTEMFLPKHPCGAEELRKLQAYVDEQIRKSEPRLPKSFDQVVAVAGTPTSLVMLQLQSDEFVENKINGYKLSVDSIWRWRDRLAGLSILERQALPGMQPQRADVLVAGATILASVARALGTQDILVSTKGVRYGVARAWQRL